MKVIQLKALQDNYVYLLREENAKLTAVVDPSEAAPVLAALKANKWNLDFVLNTHHHWDHIAGNDELKRVTGCKVVGLERDKRRIPTMDTVVKEGETFSFGSAKAHIFYIPGHTLGHIAYYFEREKALFSGDTLFSLGCGKLFEGSPAQMFSSLTQLKSLPDDVQVYCGHEYTLENAKFAAHLFATDPAFQQNFAAVQTLLKERGTTVPSLLGYEKKWNPFFLAKTVEEFASFRFQKDDF